jgi:hypothetical protein
MTFDVESIFDSVAGVYAFPNSGQIYPLTLYVANGRDSAYGVPAGVPFVMKIRSGVEAV